MKPAARFIVRWLQTLAATIAVAAACWLGAQHAFHLQLLNVQTGSMRPAFRPGDGLIMRKVSPRNIRPGMVVSYHSSHYQNLLVTHRVVAVHASSFQTKGDALSAADPPAADGRLTGEVIAIVPGLGRVIGFIQSWPGLVLCVYAPALAIATSELVRFDRSYRAVSQLQVV